MARSGPYETHPGAIAGVSFGGGISFKDVRDALIEADVHTHGGYAIRRETREFNWGGFSLVEYFFVEAPAMMGEEIFWTTIGIVIDRIRVKLRGRPTVPSDADGVHHALFHVTVAYTDESRDDLEVIGEGTDPGRAVRIVKLRSSRWEYRVETRQTPSGFTFVVAHERQARMQPPAAGNHQREV